MKKRSVVVEEVMEICKDLGVEVNPNEVTEQNKFLSAWHKSSADIDKLD